MTTTGKKGKRGTKYWRKNEEEVMERLGLKATKNSGAGFLEKEDGQSESLICQLKSTEAGSMTLKKRDIDLLEYNATVTHKVPVFAVEFKSGHESDVFIMLRPEHLREVADNILDGKPIKRKHYVMIEEISCYDNKPNVKTIKSSKDKRNKFHADKNKRYDKTKSAR